MTTRRASTKKAVPVSSLDRQILASLKAIQKKLEDIEAAIPDTEIAMLDSKLDEILRELRSAGQGS